jgi:beta-ureidopropionase / N-carbamoyl-L-amino-acid hydrolase
MHIEQGPSLYETKVPIGIVQGIVGIKSWDCVVTGFANHAGTTPMNRRKDALTAASKEVLVVRDVVRAEQGTQVGNVGYMKVEPGAVNVVPGRAEFPVQLRDLDSAKVDRMWEHIQKGLAETDKTESVETRCTLLDHSEPARADRNLQSAIREAAKSFGLPTSDLPSFAGHDAQEIARIAPMAMIFVPSKEGISHSPKEFTSWEDIAKGTEVLYRSLLLLDTQLDRE